jgi:hypothetical protein
MKLLNAEIKGNERYSQNWFLGRVTKQREELGAPSCNKSRKSGRDQVLAKPLGIYIEFGFHS